MTDAPVDIIGQWYGLLMTYVPSIIGAIIVLVVGWIVGRLLGKAVRIVLDKISEQHIIKETTEIASIKGSVKDSGLTVGYIGDIAVRIIVYLIAVLAAVDILNLEYISQLMTAIIGYIPNVIAFVILFIVGFLLIDAFIDFLAKYYASRDVQYIEPVLLLLRIFLYFITVILALSQLRLDLTIIYTFITPIAWGIGIGLGAAIAIFVGFGLRNRSEAIMDKVIESLTKKP